MLIDDVTDIVRDATIKRFEYTYEQLWKVLKHIATAEGYKALSPRSAFKEAYKLEFVSEDEEELIHDIIEKRNLTVHTYNEEMAKDIYDFIKNKAIKAFCNIEVRLKDYIS